MNQLNGYDVEDLRIGMSASFSKTITEADLVLFAGVSGDNGGCASGLPVHGLARTAAAGSRSRGHGQWSP